MAEQQFCLRWNNFQANIVTSFENLLDREEFVDVTLTAEGKSLKAHRVLLSACSPYFRDLFRDLPAHQHPVIVLRDTSFLELKSLLSFIYHGEVNVSQERLGLLLKTAEALRIKGLAQEKNSEFGSLSSSPEKEPEEGLDRGERRGGGPGSPSLPQAFAGISGSVLAPVNPLVPLDPPSHKPPHVLHSPPPKRRKPLHSPLGGPPVPIPTPPIQRENSLPQAAPVTSTASHEEDATSKVINLTMGTTESSAGSPSPRVIPKLEEEDGPGRGNSSLGGIGIGIGGIGDVGSDQEEEPIKAEDGDDDLSSSTTPDLHGLPQHLNFVPYAAAAAAAAAGSSQLDTFPGPSGVLPPASQAGWRGGHSEPSDTQAQGGSTMLALESLVGSLGGSGDENDGDIPNSGAVNSGTTSQNNILEDPLGTHDSGDAADLWAINTCSSSVLAASDFTNPLLTNHHLLPTVSLHQVTTAKAKGSGTVSCTSPSRQSCSCPLCGRHIAQRRSLKQHLMSNFHRLSPCKADSVVREYLAVVTR